MRTTQGSKDDFKSQNVLGCLVHKFGQNIMEVGRNDMEESLCFMVDKDQRQRETGRRKEQVIPKGYLSPQ